MKHFSNEETLRYVRNEWNAEDRAALEGHLYTCDQCLDMYLQVVEEEESNLPMIADETSFTDAVMVGIKEMKVTSIPVKPRPKPFYQQAFFHYFLAAAATIVLMMSGVFQSLTQYTETVQSAQIAVKTPSITEGIIDKTFNWMDSLEKKNKEVIR